MLFCNPKSMVVSPKKDKAAFAKPQLSDLLELLRPSSRNPFEDDSETALLWMANCSRAANNHTLPSKNIDPPMYEEYFNNMNKPKSEKYRERLLLKYRENKRLESLPPHERRLASLLNSLQYSKANRPWLLSIEMRNQNLCFDLVMPHESTTLHFTCRKDMHSSLRMIISDHFEKMVRSPLLFNVIILDKQGNIFSDDCFEGRAISKELDKSLRRACITAFL